MPTWSIRCLLRILNPDDLANEFRGSVLDYLINSGADLQVSRAAISATNATAEVAKALEIQRDDVLLQFASQLYDGKGKVIDYSVSYFIPGYFHFHVNRRVGNGECLGVRTFKSLGKKDLKVKQAGGCRVMPGTTITSRLYFLIARKCDSSRNKKKS